MLDKSIQHKFPKGLTYPEKSSDEGSLERHAKFPVEWRAYAANIQGDLYDNARWEFTKDDTVAGYLYSNSIEWRIRQQYLPPEGRRYILEIFAKALVKDPGKYSKSISLERIHPFQSLGQYIHLAVYLKDKEDAFPSSNFLYDQIYDIPDDVQRMMI